MKPSDLGLPDKFQGWNAHQRDAIMAAVCSDKRFVMINAPPGVGKTVVGMGISAMLGRTLYLTMTKPLQSQLMGDFESMGMKELKGQNNYPCNLLLEQGRKRAEPVACDEGPCHIGVECEMRDGGCDYYDAVRRAARAHLVSENYVHWMTMNRFGEPGALGEFDCLICDEAHELNDALADFLQVTLDRHDTRRLIRAELPFGASMEEWVEWAQEEGLPRCRAITEATRGSAALFYSGITLVKALKDLESNITMLASAAKWKRLDAADPAVWTPGATSDWVIEEEEDKVSFRPIWASGYAENYVFAGIPKVILMSATVTPRDAYYLGTTRNQMTYLAYPSPFHQKRRPLYTIPVANVGHRMTSGETRTWLKAIDRIVEKETGRGLKGIIHAVSYDRAKLIRDHSRFKDLMIIHERRTTRETVERFKAWTGPAVLISPSVGTGYDFPGDSCRFQILAKLPFIDTRPAITKARIKLDKRYQDHVALRTLIQMYGRGVRSTDDWCRNYLIDANWRWFYPRVRKMVPRWFRMAIRWADRLSEVL